MVPTGGEAYSVVGHVANILGLLENETIVDEAFTSEDAPYERAMMCFLHGERKVLMLNEAPIS